MGCSIIKYNDIGESAGLPHEILTVGREEVNVRLLGHEDRPQSLELADDCILETIHGKYLGDKYAEKNAKKVWKQGS